VEQVQEDTAVTLKCGDNVVPRSTYFVPVEVNLPLPHKASFIMWQVDEEGVQGMRSIAIPTPHTVTRTPRSAGKSKVGAEDAIQTLPEPPTLNAISLQEPKRLGPV